MSKRWLGLLLLVVWIGGGGGVAHAVVVTETPDPIDIGPVALGASGTSTGQLSAASSVDVTLQLATGGDCPQFQITSATALTLDTTPTTVTVKLTPTSAGSKSCTINVVGANPAKSFGVTGAGTVTPQITVAPPALAFGSVDVGRTSPTQRITATNTGTATLTISSASFTTGAANYTVAGTTGSQTVAPGSSAHWDIACKPAAKNAADGTFHLVSNAPSGGSPSVDLTCSGNLGVLTTDQASLDFGAVLLNGSTTRTLVLSNTGNVAVTGITAVLDKPAIGYSIDPTTPVPTSLNPNGTATLTIKFAPVTPTDGGPAKITFSGSWGTGNTTTTVVTLAGQTVSINVAPTTLAFGDFRFDSKPTQSFHIANNGLAPVAIDTVTFVPDLGTTAGEVPAKITLSGADATLPATLTGGQQFDVAVTPTPNNRTGQVSGHFVVHSTTPGIPDQNVAITGNATAASLSAPMLVDFGGVDIDGASPAQTAMITNTGVAILDISRVTKMLGGSNAFTITLPTAPIQLLPGAALPIAITYKPTTERATVETLVLVADIVGVLGGPTQAMITIRGRGIDRHLVVDDAEEFPPTYINPGSAAPTREITVHNTGEAMLSITALVITGDPVWQLVDASPVDIPGGGSHDFVVRFVPTSVASFEGLLTFTNNDKPMAIVTLTGFAVSVNVHGGGGCATGRGVGGGAVILVLVSVLIATRRRRTAGLLVVFAVVPARAFADDIRVGAFDPTPATTGTGFQLDSADVGERGDWVASGVFSFATNPMVVDVSAQGAAVSDDRPISQRTMLELGGAYAFLGRFEAGVRMPLYSQRGDAAASDPHLGLGIAPASGTALGDLTLHAKVRLVHMSQLTAGAALHLTLPTSTRDQFTGADLPSARVLGLAMLTPVPRLTLSFNGGAVVRKTAVYRKDIFIEQGSGLAWGAGASLRIVDNLFATGEVFGELVPTTKAMTGSLSPVEALLGASYRLERRFTVGVAVGRGISSGLGAPELRATFMLSFTSGAGGWAASSEPGPAVARAADSDDDGIPDDRDRCLNLAEDKNGIEDDDGCPDLDSDHDGTANWRDKCPTQAEDKDGYQDDDGCPDPDNDGDGVPDAQDKCPSQPETINGVDDDDGCPDVGGDTSTSIGVSADQSPAKAAEQTFLRGRELMQQKKYFAACAAFEQSQHLDPAAGTQYNLAGCYVEIGKLATAWTIYRELARADKNAERRAKSNELAGQLTPRVPKLKMVLTGTPVGANVFMNGTNVNALIGIEAPVDFGTYTIVAGAPKYRGWRQTVEVKKEGEVTTIEIDLGPVSAP
jgi:hypothetical protein